MNAVSLQDVSVHFGTFKAVDAVSIDVREGACFGLVGESGSGKTTLMRVVLGLQRPSSGRVVFPGLAPAAGGRARARLVQAVFQDPAASLSPRRSVGQAFAEVGELLNEEQGRLQARLTALLARVGLTPAVCGKYPYQLSGGQARRVALVRSLLVQPRILIADEPTAGLDVSVQGDLLNLLQDLRREQGLTVIVVSHNLAVVRLIADDAAVMHRGRLVEQNTAEALFDRPHSAYMQQLMASWPRLAETAG